ncbi:group II intron reverse transcriptase/maturase [Clostridium grantii]|uniref:Group II intron reverse transcriptase/maturase n=2 Tax=Clostridium grantii DSM 8605 TaxID=1121316 RepID=A0A1M5WWQ7_9CLOT|nr:group II intron reverse transcriptase/maturase [Clostridium grantii]SHH91758.1 group II intron reverse transcriptase/maturase [Clostridium grantii DSM 8605]
MYTKLNRIAEIAKENPNMQFTSLMHLIDKEMLLNCHKELKPKKAAGIDEVTKAEYENNLDRNIENLLERMKTLKYKPKPVRRTYIPKVGSNKKRPLGIPSYEDKIVQLAINKVISSIYEQDFLDSSFGFRANRSAHDAIKILDVYLSRRNINFVVDADIKGFFDNVDHKWMMKFLQHRIKDKNLLRYIGRFLNAGVLEDGKFYKAYNGTPQGGLVSPTLGNIYLHYVLDLWFEKVVRKWCKGEAYIVRYADDFVCCFQYESDAQAFYRTLKKRLAKFNLEIAEDKTKIVYFGKKAYFDRKFGRIQKNHQPKTFDFLGFTHYCSCRQNGSFRVKRKTSSKKFRASLKKVKDWIRLNMHTSIEILMKNLNRKLLGYFRYYGVTDNSISLNKFRDCVQRILYKILNRRSQVKSLNWDKYTLFKRIHKTQNYKIYVNIFELRKEISYIMQMVI